MFREGFWRRWWWLLAILVFDVFFVIWWRGNRREREAVPEADPSIAVVSAGRQPSAPVVPALSFGFPTAQTNLDHVTDEKVFMPTASGRVESALYGSVRTRSSGGRILPSFHEGIDIAPLRRDRRGRALDPVLAVADGKVAYINPSSGRSNYGIYVVLEHTDPVGTIYSLYAHLASVDKKLSEGMPVRRGETLGVMGNTPSSIVPAARAHLHLEIGMIRTHRFEKWAAAHQIKNLHGRYHGWNLTGIDPLAVLNHQDPQLRFSMLDYLQRLSPAFQLLIHTSRPLDYFERYPALWTSEGPPSGDIVLSVSEGGVILRGRSTAAEETLRFQNRSPVVLDVDTDVLGRNGQRLVMQRSGRWELGSAGQQWLDILTF